MSKKNTKIKIPLQKMVVITRRELEKISEEDKDRELKEPFTEQLLFGVGDNRQFNVSIDKKVKKYCLNLFPYLIGDGSSPWRWKVTIEDDSERSFVKAKITWLFNRLYKLDVDSPPPQAVDVSHSPTNKVLMMMKILTIAIQPVDLIDDLISVMNDLTMDVEDCMDRITSIEKKIGTPTTRVFTACSVAFKTAEEAKAFAYKQLRLKLQDFVSSGFSSQEQSTDDGETSSESDSQSETGGSETTEEDESSTSSENYGLEKHLLREFLTRNRQFKQLPDEMKRKNLSVMDRKILNTTKRISKIGFRAAAVLAFASPSAGVATALASQGVKSGGLATSGKGYVCIARVEYDANATNNDVDDNVNTSVEDVDVQIEGMELDVVSDSVDYDFKLEDDIPLTDDSSVDFDLLFDAVNHFDVPPFESEMDMSGNKRVRL